VLWGNLALNGNCQLLLPDPACRSELPPLTRAAIGTAERSFTNVYGINDGKRPSAIGPNSVHHRGSAWGIGATVPTPSQPASSPVSFFIKVADIDWWQGRNRTPTRDFSPFRRF